MVRVIAGGGVGDFTDGKGHALFRLPRGVAMDSSNNIIVADSGNYRIRRINADGVHMQHHRR